MDLKHTKQKCQAEVIDKKKISAKTFVEHIQGNNLNVRPKALKDTCTVAHSSVMELKYFINAENKAMKTAEAGFETNEIALQ